MKKLLLLFCLFTTVFAMAQTPLTFTEAKFIKGDNPQYQKSNYDDSRWATVPINQLWPGSSNDDSFGWYRIRFSIPSSFASGVSNPLVIFDLGNIDDVDETYLNGELIGKTGRMPNGKDGYVSAWDTPRRYAVDRAKVSGENVLAIRVYNKGGEAGIRGQGFRISQPSLIEGIELSPKETAENSKKTVMAITCRNIFPLVQKGKINIVMKDAENGAVLKTIDKKVALNANSSQTFDMNFTPGKHVRFYTTFTAGDGKTVSGVYSSKYILTPAAPAAPRYNGALVYGVRPGSPVIFHMAFSGVKPMRYAVEGLAEGLKLDVENGVISGSIATAGNYEMTLVAENAKGKAEQKFTIKVGDKLALTPPMGWNSWNCWGLSVSQEKVKSSAQAILDKGLADYGYSYVNIDDAWEAAERNADGTIAPNEKFPNMKSLGDWLHQHGLRFGIYSSPGERTCGGYLGSLGHEKQDAETYNSWGVDYLKYDWCSYTREFEPSKDHTLAAYVWPYLHMERYLRQQPRDIFYSLCQYGFSDVWKWGFMVDANSWRTTGDITDTWKSLYDIGFNRQAELYPYSAPGHWNDPDMLIVGKVGWSASLRDTRLTPDEQYTHISLWALLAANMLIGCDVSQMDNFTLSLLCNNEVNAVNQDILGQQAKREVKDGDIQIWKRPLADGSYAVGIFNVGSDDKNVDIAKYYQMMGISKPVSVRDLWRQKDLNVDETTYNILLHGVMLLKIRCQ